MEVIVEFLEGDPDKPIVTGCVYNGKNKVPYELPKHKTRSTFKTDTHQGAGFNELRFEDKLKREEIFLRAQKDRNEKTRGDYVRLTDRDEAHYTGGDKLVRISGTHQESVTGGYSLMVKSGADLQAASREAHDKHDGLNSIIARFRNVLGNVGAGSYALFVQGASKIFIAGSSKEEVRGTKVVTIGRSLETRVEGIVHFDAHKRFGINASSLSLTAKDAINIQVGKASLVMRKDGYIALRGNIIDLTSQQETSLSSNGETTIESAGSHTVKASRIDLN